MCCVHVANVYCSFSRTYNNRAGTILTLNHCKKHCEVWGWLQLLLIRRQSQLKTFIGCFYLVLEVLLKQCVCMYLVMWYSFVYVICVVCICVWAVVCVEGGWVDVWGGEGVGRWMYVSVWVWYNLFYCCRMTVPLVRFRWLGETTWRNWEERSACSGCLLYIELVPMKTVMQWSLVRMLLVMNWHTYTEYSIFPNEVCSSQISKTVSF